LNKINSIDYFKTGAPHLLYFCNSGKFLFISCYFALSVVDNTDAIMEYFLVNSGCTRKELSVQYHFSNELRGILSLVLSPPAHTNARSPATDEASVTCATALESRQ
jgi:hypothetical protein